MLDNGVSFFPKFISITYRPSYSTELCKKFDAQELWRILIAHKQPKWCLISLDLETEFDI